MAFTFTINPGYVLGATEAVTNDKLNAMLALAYATVLSGTLDTAQIGDLQVTAAKLAATLDLSGKTLTLPTNVQPKTGANVAALGTPDFIGQVGVLTDGTTYVAKGISSNADWYWNGHTQTADPNTATPTFIGQLTYFNSNWYVGYALTIGAWTNLTPTSPNNLSAFVKHNLKVFTASTTTVTITADDLSLAGASDTKLVTAVNVTVNSAAAGANGLDTGALATAMYYFWIIYNPTTATTAGLMSASATAPTMPTGYTYKRLVGEVYYTAGGTNAFTGTHRAGDEVYFENAQAILNSGGGAFTVTASMVAKDLPVTVPSGAIKLHLELGSTSSGTYTDLMIAPDVNTRFEVCSPGAHSATPSISASGAYYPFFVDMKHLGAASVYAKSGTGGTPANQCAYVWGYVLER